MRPSLVRFAQKYDVFASVLVSRSPVIAPIMSEVERRFQEVQLSKERQNALLCDFELKTKKDEDLIKQRAELEASGKELSELDGEIGVTNAMKMDDWNRKSAQLEAQYNLQNPKFYESTSEQSLMRQLDRKLVLIVKQKFGESSYNSPWIFPQKKHRDGESLRQTAERCLGDINKVDMQVHLCGNAPFSVHTYKYPKPLAKKLDTVGAKLFFYSAVISPKANIVMNDEEISDLRWCTREELWSLVPGRRYKNSIQSVFLE